MWKRFKIYEGSIVIFFFINMVFYIINMNFLNFWFPKDIAGYFFWLSLGLYLGFQFCKYEVNRIMKKKNKFF